MSAFSLPTTPKASLTIYTIFRVIPPAIIGLLTALTYLLTLPFTPRATRPRSFFKYLVYAFSRAFLRRLDSQIEGTLVPPTATVYSTWCTRHAIAPHTETLPDGTTAHWLGPRSAQHVMLYFHGGGYTHALQPSHLEFLSAILARVNRDPQRPLLAVLVLAYPCAPKYTYPAQLISAAHLFSFALEGLALPPERILFAGDSAGGHLVLSLLGHVLHGCATEGVPRVEVRGRVRGVCLLSPWVELRPKGESVMRNRWKDGIDNVSCGRWAAAFLGGAEEDGWSCPGRAAEGWWSRLGDVVEEIFVAAGGDEIMLDDIVGLVRRLEREAEVAVTSVVLEDESHDSILTERMLGFKDVKMDGEMRKWLEGLLRHKEEEAK